MVTCDRSCSIKHYELSLIQDNDIAFVQIWITWHCSEESNFARDNRMLITIYSSASIMSKPLKDSLRKSGLHGKKQSRFFNQLAFSKMYQYNTFIYVMLRLSTRIFDRGVPGFVSDYPRGVWCRELTTCILYVGPLAGNLVRSDSRYVHLT